MTVARGRALALGVVTAVGLALGFLPQLAGPSYELALAVGLVCPSIAATTAALSHRRRAPLSELFDAIHLGVTLALAALGAALVHGVRAGFCDLRAGLHLFALGPMAGIVLAAAWGFCAAELACALESRAAARRALGRRPRLLRIALGLAGPLGSASSSLALFYATPMVFAFDPFVGYFSGALYDTVLAYGQLTSYRAASLLTLTALYVAALHARRTTSGRLALVSLGRPGLAALFVVALAASVATVALGNELGHWQTRDTITRALGESTASESCVVLHEPALAEEAARVAKECSAHTRELSQWLGLAPGPRPPVTAFLFKSAEQKRFFMGAGHTSIAKPWRRELYLQTDETPHPVLRHELVHVLAAAHARGPFAVAGAIGGLVPNPGVIEGLAEAAAPRDDDLGVDEWSAAMRRIGVLPRLEHLFSLRFFAAASGASYTAAGSFLLHLRKLHGPVPLARLYRGESFEEIVGEGLGELEKRWWSELDGIRVTSAAIAEARLRFDRPGVLGRRCPHEVDRLLADAGGRTDAEPRRALEGFEKALALDAANVRALFGVAACHDRARRAELSEASLVSLAVNASVPEAAQLSAREKVGDLLLRRGERARAREVFAEVMARVGDEGRLRTLELKHAYADHDEARPALVALLIGTTHTGPDSAEALDRLALWRGHSASDGTPDYLIARQHFLARRYAFALEGLGDARLKGLSLPRVAAEAERLTIRAACALGEPATAEAAFARYERMPGLPRERLRAMRDLVGRCR